ncbi:MAG: hypothetical protein ACREXX_17175 [Gammaproteobacteria bacterium]
MVGDACDRDDGPDQLAVLVPDRGTHVLNWERRAVFSSKNFIRYAMDGTIAKGGVDGTFCSWIGGPVSFGMVEDVVLGLADQFLGLPSDHAGCDSWQESYPC